MSGPLSNGNGNGKTSSADGALWLIGVSHHTATVGLRERLAFRAADLPRALGGLLAHGCREAVILSTCNRVEVMVVAQDNGDDLNQRVRAYLSEYHGVPESEFAKSIYELRGLEVPRHLFEVAASLDSQILGETEILAQSKEAYRVAAEHGSCGPLLRGIFERSFFLAKEVRGDGGIGRTQASVSSAAVQLAKKVFEVRGRKVLVVGTGEMATGIVRALRSAGVSELWVASRSEARAKEFADQEGGKPCLLQHLEQHLEQVDIVLVSSAAPHYIIGPDLMAAVSPKRRGRLLCLIDISVPRNVDPAVHKIEDTFLYDIDDLEEVARDGRRERELVAARWRPRLAEEAREILHKLQDADAQAVARKLLDRVAAIRQEILQNAGSAGMDAPAAEALARALERMQGRLLHGPLETLKQAAREGQGAEAAAWISRFFRLETPVTATSESRCPVLARKRLEAAGAETSPAAPVFQNGKQTSVEG
jgi:glutamyl-tRNA reductase